MVQSMYKAKLKGFTLIELMIVVAIIGIIATIAYPSYDQYIVRAKRADAMSALMLASNAYERYRANKYDFNVGIGTIFATQVPVEGGAAYYNITTLAPTAANYTIIATPTGSMAGKEGALTLTNTGARTWTDKNAVLHNCWPEGGNSC